MDTLCSSLPRGIWQKEILPCLCWSTLLKQDIADSASQVCRYILPFIFLGRFSKLCRSLTARKRKRTLFFLLQQRKILCCARENMMFCTREAVPYYYVTEIRRTSSIPQLRKKNSIIYSKGAVTRIHKIFNGDAFIGKERNSSKNETQTWTN